MFVCKWFDAQCTYRSINKTKIETISNFSVIFVFLSISLVVCCHPKCRSVFGLSFLPT